MPAKRFYFHTEATLNGAPAAPTGCATISETAPDQTDANGGGGGHLSTNTGAEASLLNKPFAIDRTEVAGAPPTTNPPASAHEFGWFSDVKYSGTFDTGNWIAIWREFDNRTGIAGHAVLNIYANTTRDFGGSIRFIGQLITPADWWVGAASPGSALAAQAVSLAGFTLNNEYLFFQVWCHETSGFFNNRSLTLKQEGSDLSDANRTNVLSANFTPSPTTQTISGVGNIASAEAFGSATVRTSQLVAPSSIASTEAVGTAKLNQTIAKAGNIGPVVLSDSCTDTDGTELSNHKAETGVSYSKATYQNVGTSFIFNNRITKDSSPSPVIYYDTGPSLLNAVIRSTFTMLSSLSNNVGLVLRLQTGSDNYYYARHNRDANEWRITKSTNSAPTTIGNTASETLIADDSREVEFWCIDINGVAHLGLRVAGVVIITGTDNSPHPAGKVGVRMSGAASSTTGYAIDNLVSEEITVGTPEVDQLLSIQPVGIASAESIGAATVVRGSVTVMTSAISSAEAFGTTTILQPQSIAPAAIASGEAFGNAIISRTIAPPGIASAEAVGTATVVRGSVTISTTGIASAEAFGTAKLSRTITTSGIATAEAFGNLSAQRGPVTITPASIASTEAFGTPTILPGAANVSPSAIASAEAFGNAILLSIRSLAPSSISSAEAFGTSALHRTISPSGITSSEAFGNPIVNSGAIILSPSAIASAEAFGTPTLLPGAATIAPPSISSAEAFGSPSLARVVSALSIASAEAFGSARLSRTITAAAIASAEAFGTTVLQSGGSTIFAPSIASAESFGTPTLQRGSVTIAPAAIVSAEAFGSALVKGANTLAPTGIASTEVFGAPTLHRTINVPGVASSEAFGEALVNSGGIILNPFSINSAEAFGTPTLQRGAVTIAPSSITSAEAFGAPTVTSEASTISPPGIASSETFGNAALLRGPATISPPGIASTEAFGNVSLSFAQSIQPSSIVSAEAFGLAAVNSAAIRILVAGIASAEMFGTLRLQQEVVIFLPAVKADTSFTAVALETEFDAVSFLGNLSDV